MSVAAGCEYEPEGLIDAVRPWVLRRSRRYAREAGRPDLADELTDAVFAKIGELLSEGYSGPRRYDPSRGAPTTWAERILRSELLDAFGRLAGPYVVTVHGRRMHSLARRAGDDPGPLLPRCLSFADVRPGDGDDWDPPAPGPCEDRDRADRREEVLAAVEALPPRQREVATLYFGLGGEPELTLAEVGARMGFTKERARQVRDDALARLRVALAGAIEGGGAA